MTKITQKKRSVHFDEQESHKHSFKMSDHFAW